MCSKWFNSVVFPWKDLLNVQLMSWPLYSLCYSRQNRDKTIMRFTVIWLFLTWHCYSYQKKAYWYVREYYESRSYNLSCRECNTAELALLFSICCSNKGYFSSIQNLFWSANDACEDLKIHGRMHSLFRSICYPYVSNMHKNEIIQMFCLKDGAV